MNRERTTTSYEQNVDDWYRPMPKQKIAIRVENASEVSCIVDTCEELLAQSTPVSRLDAAIKKYDVAISRNDGEGSRYAVALLSDPYEVVVDNSQAEPRRLATSAVVFKLWENDDIDVGDKLGELVIFKQSIYAVNGSLPEPTVEDCKWGENCTAGVIVEHDRQTWIRLTQSNDESSRSIIQEIDPSSNEAAQLQMKLEKFLTVQEERREQNERDRRNQMQFDDGQPRAIDDIEISLW